MFRMRFPLYQSFRPLLVWIAFASVTVSAQQADPLSAASAEEESSVVETPTSGSSEEFLDDRFYIAPFGTFMQPGGDRKAFGAWGAGMGIGKVINEWLNLEIRGFWMNYSNNRPGGGGQTDVTGGSADALFFFDRDVFSPYAVFSLGANNTSYRTAFSSGNSQEMFQWQAGVGSTYEIADNFLLRGDVRYQGMFQNGSPNASYAYGNYNSQVLNDLVVNAGFVIPLGEKPVPVVAAAPAAVDDCSTRDSDGDGVNDCDDKCPGTMKGAKVDEYGCLVRIELRGVNFHYDSAELTEAAKGILDEVSAGLIASGETKDIEVQGHTSTEGTDQYNMKLSQRRAASVVDYLKMKGVPNTLYPKGYGEMYPKVSPDRTEEERSVNRRVELVWMGE